MPTASEAHTKYKPGLTSSRGLRVVPSGCLAPRCKGSAAPAAAVVNPLLLFAPTLGSGWPSVWPGED